MTPDPILATPVKTPQTERPDLYLRVYQQPYESGFHGVTPAHPVRDALTEDRQKNWQLFMLPGTARIAAMDKFKELFSEYVESVGGVWDDLQDAAREAGLLEDGRK